MKGAIIQSGNDSCIALAEGMAGNERIFAAAFPTKKLPLIWGCAKQRT